MKYKRAIQWFRRCYAALLRLYPQQYRERYGEPMEQLFFDLLKERARPKSSGALRCAIWLFAETTVAIVRENLIVMSMQKKSILRISVATAFLLLLPLVAMQFTNEVVWGPADFAVAGILLISAGSVFELIASRSEQLAYRAAVGIAVAAALLLVWMNLAVGIIGNESNPANLMYVGVLAVGMIGVLLARLQSRGMARALFATAFAQTLVAGIALIGESGSENAAWPGDVLMATAFFVALWLASALLFLRAETSGSDSRMMT